MKHVLKAHHVPIKFASKDTIKTLENAELDNFTVSTLKLFVKHKKVDGVEVSLYEHCGVAIVNNFEQFLVSQISKYKTHQFQVGFDKGGEKSATSTKLTFHPHNSQSPHDCTVIGIFYATDCYSNISAAFGSIFEKISSLDGTMHGGHRVQFFLGSDGPAKALVEGHSASAKAKHFCLLCMCSLYSPSFPQSQLIFWKHLPNFITVPSFLENFYLFSPVDTTLVFQPCDGIQPTADLVGSKDISMFIPKSSNLDWLDAWVEGPQYFLQVFKVKTYNMLPPHPSVCGVVMYDPRTAELIKKHYAAFVAAGSPHQKQKSFGNIINPPLWVVKDRLQVGRRPLHNILGLIGKALDLTKELYDAVNPPVDFVAEKFQTTEEKLAKGLTTATSNVVGKTRTALQTALAKQATAHSTLHEYTLKLKKIQRGIVFDRLLSEFVHLQPYHNGWTGPMAKSFLLNKKWNLFLKKLFEHPPASLVSVWSTLEKVYTCTMHGKPFDCKTLQLNTMLRCASIGSVFPKYGLGSSTKLHDVGFHYGSVVCVGGRLILEQALEHSHARLNRIEIPIRTISNKVHHTELVVRRSLACQNSSAAQDIYRTPSNKCHE